MYLKYLYKGTEALIPKKVLVKVFFQESENIFYFVCSYFPCNCFSLLFLSNCLIFDNISSSQITFLVIISNIYFIFKGVFFWKNAYCFISFISDLLKHMS
jgi:hypothetical protein